MLFRDSKVKAKTKGNYRKYYYDNINPSLQAIRDEIPIKIETIQNMDWPIYLNYNSYCIQTPQIYKLNNYKDRSIFESNIIEFWAPITDFIVPNVLPGRYWISTWGRTWNCNTRKNIGYSFKEDGYAQITCTTTDKKVVCRRLHRIIMMTFAYFEGCENFQVNHRDGIRDDNRIYNLEWCTASENVIYGINYGNIKVFGHDYNSNLSLEQIDQILDLHYNHGKTASEIMNILNLNGVISKSSLKSIWGGINRTTYVNNYLNNR